MKSNIMDGKNSIKRVFYRGRVTKFKNIILYMVIAGIVAAVAALGIGMLSFLRTKDQFILYI